MHLDENASQRTDAAKAGAQRFRQVRYNPSENIKITNAFFVFPLSRRVFVIVPMASDIPAMRLLQMDVV